MFLARSKGLGGQTATLGKGRKDEVSLRDARSAFAAPFDQTHPMTNISAEEAQRVMKIIDWRSKIDAIDTALLHLLNLRTELALEVGRLKADEGVALRVPAREQEILSRMKSLNPGPLAIDSIAKIYQVILDESIRTQEQYGLGSSAYPVAAKPVRKRRR